MLVRTDTDETALVRLIRERLSLSGELHLAVTNRNDNCLRDQINTAPDEMARNAREQAAVENEKRLEAMGDDRACGPPRTEEDELVERIKERLELVGEYRLRITDERQGVRQYALSEDRLSTMMTAERF
jgi:hypothetical protein